MSARILPDPDLRRSVLFVAGADADAQARALDAAPDVLVQDLEDFTPAALKGAARQRCAPLCREARSRGLIAAVRINALAEGGLDDLPVAMAAGVDCVFLPKTGGADEVAALAQALGDLETTHRLAPGTLEIVPNIETAAGLVDLRAIAHASRRVRSALLATEDLAADLGAERGADAEELAYARSRFLLEARALRIEPIDAPYTYADAEGCAREARRSRRLGYRSKSTVSAAHVAVLHEVLTPGTDEVARAGRIVAAYTAARAAGIDRPLVDGLWIEPPMFRTAQRLLERARRLRVAPLGN
jgi:citrate lyase subunit beta/citryl-CoA lyase